MPPRKRYKLYGEPENIGMPIPKSTLSRAKGPVRELNLDVQEEYVNHSGDDLLEPCQVDEADSSGEEDEDVSCQTRSESSVGILNKSFSPQGYEPQTLDSSSTEDDDHVSSVTSSERPIGGLSQSQSSSESELHARDSSGTEDDGHVSSVTSSERPIGGLSPSHSSQESDLHTQGSSVTEDDGHISSVISSERSIGGLRLSHSSQELDLHTQDSPGNDKDDDGYNISQTSNGSSVENCNESYSSQGFEQSTQPIDQWRKKVENPRSSTSQVYQVFRGEHDESDVSQISFVSQINETEGCNEGGNSSFCDQYVNQSLHGAEELNTSFLRSKTSEGSGQYSGYGSSGESSDHGEGIVDLSDIEIFESDNAEDEDDPEPTLPYAQEDPQQEFQNFQAPPLHTSALKEQLVHGSLSRRIENNAAASRSEVLLNILEFSQRHNLTNAAKEDFHKVVNSIFYSEVIPETRYKIDKLYSCDSHVYYFFYCSKCFENLGALDYKTVKIKICPNCNAENVLSDLTKAFFFLIVDIVKQFELLLNEPGVAAQLKNPNELCNDGNILSDLYDGTMYRDFAASLDYDEGFSFISLTACTDGSPLFRSSSCLSIWPIFVMINELPPYLRMSNVLLSGLWFGRQEPKMDLFLHVFTDNITSLSQNNGFEIIVNETKKSFKAYLIACCVDSGARGSVQCVHKHNGSYPCNWCLHPGETEGNGSNARKFRVLPVTPPKRTKAELINDGRKAMALPGIDVHVNGVLGVTPLCRNPKFDPVDGMIVDYLHWACLGVSKRFCKVWMGDFSKKNVDANVIQPRYYIGTDETKALINSRIKKLQPPKEVRRLPREITYLSIWNAREWENFILFYSVPVLKGILPDRYLNHWVLFVQAFYLLMKSEISMAEVEVARSLFSKFVDQVEGLYGLKELTFNVHISLHAADNVQRWGPLWSISTFSFESAIGLLKRKLHAERGIPHQIIRCFNEDLALQLLRSKSTTPQTSRLRIRMARKEVIKSFYVGNVQCIMPRSFFASREEMWLCNRENIAVEDFQECKKIIVNHTCYSLFSGARTNNSFAQLKDDRIVKLRKIIVSEIHANVYLFVSRVRCLPCMIPRDETNAPFDPFLFKVELIENELDIVSWRALKTVCVYTPIKCRYLESNFLSLLPNNTNVV